MHNISSKAEVQNMDLDVRETGVRYTYAMRNYDEGSSNGRPSDRVATISAECKKSEVKNITFPSDNKTDIVSMNNARWILPYNPMFSHTWYMYDNSSSDCNDQGCSAIYELNAYQFSRPAQAADIGFWRCTNSLKLDIDAGVYGSVLLEKLNLTDELRLYLTAFAAGQSSLSYTNSYTAAWSFGSLFTSLFDMQYLRTPSGNRTLNFGIPEAARTNDIKLSEIWVAIILARTTALALAYMDMTRPEIEIRKGLNHTILRLVVHWGQLYAIIIILSLLQILLVVLAYLYCQDVIVRDDGVFSVGKAAERLLQEVNGGTIANSEEIMEALGTDFKVMYGTTIDSDGNRRAELWKLVDNYFPDGLYCKEGKYSQTASEEPGVSSAIPALGFLVCTYQDI
ncbi:hypothetical protein K440DRAFT_640179 [Wilcoxina mikolae CBS 423.85]|nr:hypothetical protein K440DRAFT_640179 [Wilcoxina mikolae CBS 423.85]